MSLWRNDEGDVRWDAVVIILLLVVVAFVVLWVLPFVFGWWWYSKSSSVSYTAPQYYIVPNTTYSFAYPVVGAASYQEGGIAPNSLNPWTMSGTAGIAANGSTWDPPDSATAPCGTQYAFLQASGGFPVNITAGVRGLVSGQQYQVALYFSQRGGQSIATTTYNALTVQLTDENNIVYVIYGIAPGTNTYGLWAGRTSPAFTWTGAGYPQLAVIATPTQGVLDTSLLIDCFEILTIAA